MNTLLSILPKYKLYMLLLGSKAPKRNVEQHDYFFGIATSLKDLIPEIKAFWPEAGASIHLDGWREIKRVGDYEVKVLLKDESESVTSRQKLFFINLGGYQSNKLEEQHYTVLSVHEESSAAIKEAKKTVFYKSHTIKGAPSHIDEKYGIDVDDIYRIEDLLSDSSKDKFSIEIVPVSEELPEEIILGYFKIE